MSTKSVCSIDGLNLLRAQQLSETRLENELRKFREALELKFVASAQIRENEIKSQERETYIQYVQTERARDLDRRIYSVRRRRQNCAEKQRQRFQVQKAQEQIRKESVDHQRQLFYERAAQEHIENMKAEAENLNYNSCLVVARAQALQAEWIATETHRQEELDQRRRLAECKRSCERARSLDLRRQRGEVKRKHLEMHRDKERLHREERARSYEAKAQTVENREARRNQIMQSMADARAQLAITKELAGELIQEAARPTTASDAEMLRSRFRELVQNGVRRRARSLDSSRNSTQMSIVAEFPRTPRQRTPSSMTSATRRNDCQEKQNDFTGHRCAREEPVMQKPIIRATRSLTSEAPVGIASTSECLVEKKRNISHRDCVPGEVGLRAARSWTSEAPTDVGNSSEISSGSTSCNAASTSSPTQNSLQHPGVDDEKNSTEPCAVRFVATTAPKRPSLVNNSTFAAPCSGSMEGGNELVPPIVQCDAAAGAGVADILRRPRSCSQPVAVAPRSTNQPGTVAVTKVLARPRGFVGPARAAATPVAMANACRVVWALPGCSLSAARA